MFFKSDTILELFFTVKGIFPIEDVFAALDVFFTVTVSQYSVIADLTKALGEDMQKEPADELLHRKGHSFALIVPIIFPKYSDPVIFQGNDFTVRQCYAVNIPGYIFKHQFRPV